MSGTMSGTINERGMVIIGAGEAGVRAAIELRERGWSGTVTIIGEEKRRPYERPPLSKEALSGAETPVITAISGTGKLDELGIRLLTGETATRIDRAERCVELASGGKVPYEKLLLATGAKPRRFGSAGSGSGDLLYLRRFEDALALRDRLAPGTRAVIIGGGFIGLETAASATSRGCEVTLLEMAPRLLTRGVPAEIAATVQARHQAAGATMIFGCGIAGVDRASDGSLTIRLADGSEVVCDVAIAGIGAVPETALAEQCGLDIENGVKVDGYLTTSDPHILAAGDCCSFPHALYGGRRVRLEAWRNAQDQGAYAAAVMLGQAEEPYDVVPWFWSDQYDLTLQSAGLTDGTETAVFRELGETGTIAFYLAADGTLVSACGIGPTGGIAKEVRLAEMLIAKRAKPDAAVLADPARKLRDLLKSV